jgi:hypothetical protein
MEAQTLAIPVGFILLAALLCWWIIGTKGAWWKKLMAIVLVPAFGLAIWSSLSSYSGWPTSRALPEKALVLWAEIREPDEKSGDPGEILLLLRPLVEKEEEGFTFFDYATPQGKPRLYKLPYSRNMHQAAETANGMIRAGKQVVLDGSGKGRGDGQGGDGQGEPGDGEGGGPPGYRYDPDRADPQVYELPPPRPPEKPPE